MKKTGTFTGSKTMTVKKVFAGKSVKVASYRLKLSADSGSVTLSFKVVKGSTGGASTAPTGSAPANSALPAISGTAWRGQTLSASIGTWSNSPTSYAYQWRRCDSSGSSCSNISGASSNTYALGYADTGSTIRVVVTATNSHGSSSATSSQTAVVTGPLPTNSALPTISGTTTQGQTLTASDGSWNDALTYAYQWHRCDSAGANCLGISGATSFYYVLQTADVSHTIRIVVTASNLYGSVSATSVQTATISSPPPGALRENPIPLGQPGAVGNGWTVAVTNVYPDATAAVLAANPYNDAPAAGNQFFMIAVTATYSGSGSSHLDSGFSMRAVGASNVAYTTFDNSCGVLPDPDLYLDDPEVFTGGTVSGNAACWQIRSSDASSLVMFFKPYLSDTASWFALH